MSADRMDEAVRLLDEALLLRENRKPRPEAWAYWEQRCEEFLRYPPPEEPPVPSGDPTVLCSFVIGPTSTVDVRSERHPERILMEIRTPSYASTFSPEDAVILDLVRRPSTPQAGEQPDEPSSRRR